MTERKNGVMAVMAKRPGAQAKTRLGGVLTEDQRRILAEGFLRDKTRQLGLMGRRTIVAVAPPDAPEAVRSLVGPEPALVAQRGDDLGQRLFSVLDLVFLDPSVDWVALVDADTPTLPLSFLEEAAIALDAGTPMVLGPAWDGGYYLIGLSRSTLREPFFHDMPWSTAQVFPTTLRRARERGLSPHVLRSWYDIDTPRELAWLRAELRQTSPFVRGYPAATAASLDIVWSGERMDRLSPNGASCESVDDEGNLRWLATEQSSTNLGPSVPASAQRSPSESGPEALPLLEHPPAEVSVFTPGNLIEAVRDLRGLSTTRVPRVCVLEFDGDLSDTLERSGVARPHAAWACFHTRMSVFQVDGEPVGMVSRSIGGPYAVLIAEQLVASGAEIILGLTSAGRVSAALRLPSLVVATGALRDEGTSFHYLPPARQVAGDGELAAALAAGLSTLDLPVARGLVWTTDAPYRETRERIAARAREGALAVEMQTASLFAFGEAVAKAKGSLVGVVAHVTNAIDAEAEPFFKGPPDIEERILFAMCRAALAFTRR